MEYRWRRRGTSQLRFWQFADGRNSSPYILASPVPENRASTVKGRLCGILAYNDFDLLEDLNSIAHARGFYLRIYTATIKGGTLRHSPRTAAAFANTTILSIGNAMSLYTRARIRDATGLEKPGPEHIDLLLEAFPHIDTICYHATLAFGGMTHKNLHIAALRDPSQITGIDCLQSPCLKLDDIHVIA